MTIAPIKATAIRIPIVATYRSENAYSRKPKAPITVTPPTTASTNMTSSRTTKRVSKRTGTLSRRRRSERKNK